MNNTKIKRRKLRLSTRSPQNTSVYLIKKNKSYFNENEFVVGGTMMDFLGESDLDTEPSTPQRSEEYDLMFKQPIKLFQFFRCFSE